jgi:hypothetical protein
MKESSDLLRIDLTGLDSGSFDRLFASLASALEAAVAQVSGKPESPEARQAIDDLTVIAKNFAQAKLQRPTLENQKLLAEIAEAFSAAEVNAQQARKTAAEADKIEMDNVVHRVHVILELLAATKRVRVLAPPEREALIIDVSSPATVPPDAPPSSVEVPGRQE